MSKYILGISGTHGTGKSYLSHHLEPHFKVDSSQLSRTAQKALGWDSLSRAQESEENMWALQNSILDAMIARDAAITESRVITVAERTPADLYAYTRMWLERLKIDSNSSTKFIDYHRRLVHASNAYLRVFVIFPHESIPFVAEPNRADEASREYVSKEICSFISGRTISNNNSSMIFCPNIHDRVKAVLSSLNLESTR